MDQNKKSAHASARRLKQHCWHDKLITISLWQSWPLLLLLLAGCSSRDADPSTVNEPVVAANDTVAAEVVANRDTAGIDTLDPTLDAEIDWGKNPFLPPGTPKMPPVNSHASNSLASNEGASPPTIQPRRWNLKGILARNGRWIAIINQKILASGDKIDGYKLIAINRDSATLAKDDETIVLRLK